MAGKDIYTRLSRLCACMCSSVLRRALLQDQKGGVLQDSCYCQMCKGPNTVMCRESEEYELRGMSQLLDKLVIDDLLPMPNTEEEVTCLT